MRWTVPDLPSHWAQGLAPVFVGRRRELDVLDEAWAAVLHGSCHVVFVGGEPGAGKARGNVPGAARQGAIPAADTRRAPAARGGAALAAPARPGAADTHGTQVPERYRVGGARQEAALGMPAVFELALP